MTPLRFSNMTFYYIVMKHLSEQISESLLGVGLLGLGAIYVIGSIVGYSYMDEKSHKDDFDEKEAVTWLAKEYKKVWDEFKEDMKKLKDDPDIQAAMSKGKAGLEEFRRLVSKKINPEAKAFFDKISQKLDRFKK